MVQSSAQVCGRTVRCAVEAMRTRDEIESSRAPARIKCAKAAVESMSWKRLAV
jgi:hypothetical protein